MILGVTQSPQSKYEGFTLGQLFNKASAQGEVNYSVGYIDNPQPCEVTETRNCSIVLCYGGFCCRLGFDYTVTFKGTQNYCTYTGGPSGCTPHACIKNG